jgi:HK97 family phage major capsid protein
MTLKEKLYDLKNQRKTLLDTAKALALEGKHDTEDYKTKMADVDKLNAQIKALEDVLTQDESGMEPDEDPTVKGMKGVAASTPPAGDPEPKANAVKAFADAARNGFVVTKAAGDLSQEGVDADGGYTVPEDIVTRVETYRQSKANLRALVGVESVTTSKGRRTFKTRSQQTGFSKVSEGGKIAKKSGPQFSVLNYAISKYAGFLPVTNELLEDSDENITQVLTEWIGDEARVTDNTLILAAINLKAKVALDGIDGLKKAVLVDLDSAFRATTKITTNSNGIYWLSTQKDTTGRDLLTPVPSEPGKMQLACGAVVIPVEELPNADLPNDGTKIPCIVGDLQEGIRLFDRKQLTVSSSDVAVAGDFNAFEQDMTLTKALLREDVQQRDDSAYINGYIDTAAAAG